MAVYIPGYNTGTRFCHYYDGDMLYVIDGAGSGLPSYSTFSTFTADIYSVSQGYNFQNTISLERGESPFGGFNSDYVDGHIYFCNTQGGWGAKAEYTSDPLSAIGSDQYVVNSIIIIIAIIWVPLWFFRKFWRKV